MKKIFKLITLIIGLISFSPTIIFSAARPAAPRLPAMPALVRERTWEEISDAAAFLATKEYASDWDVDESIEGNVSKDRAFVRDSLQRLKDAYLKARKEGRHSDAKYWEEVYNNLYSVYRKNRENPEEADITFATIKSAISRLPREISERITSVARPAMGAAAGPATPVASLASQQKELDEILARATSDKSFSDLYSILRSFEQNVNSFKFNTLPKEEIISARAKIIRIINSKPKPDAGPRPDAILPGKTPLDYPNIMAEALLNFIRSKESNPGLTVAAFKKGFGDSRVRNLNDNTERWIYRLWNVLNNIESIYNKKPEPEKAKSISALAFAHKIYELFDSNTRSPQKIKETVAQAEAIDWSVANFVNNLIDALNARSISAPPALPYSGLGAARPAAAAAAAAATPPVATPAAIPILSALDIKRANAITWKDIYDDAQILKTTAFNTTDNFTTDSSLNRRFVATVLTQLQNAYFKSIVNGTYNTLGILWHAGYNQLSLDYSQAKKDNSKAEATFNLAKTFIAQLAKEMSIFPEIAALAPASAPVSLARAVANPAAGIPRAAAAAAPAASRPIAAPAGGYNEETALAQAIEESRLEKAERDRQKRLELAAAAIPRAAAGAPAAAAIEPIDTKALKEIFRAVESQAGARLDYGALNTYINERINLLNPRTQNILRLFRDALTAIQKEHERLPYGEQRKQIGSILSRITSLNGDNKDTIIDILHRDRNTTLFDAFIRAYSAALKNPAAPLAAAAMPI